MLLPSKHHHRIGREVNRGIRDGDLGHETKLHQGVGIVSMHPIEYINNFLQRFEMTDCKLTLCLMEMSLKLKNCEDETDEKRNSSLRIGWCYNRNIYHIFLEST